MPLRLLGEQAWLVPKLFIIASDEESEIMWMGRTKRQGLRFSKRRRQAKRFAHASNIPALLQR
jgi:hypothetical protein